MEVQKEGQVVANLRQKSKWLLAILVLRRGKESDYEELGRLLWPDPPGRESLGNKKAISSVRQCVSNLNILLGSEKFTKSSRSAIGIDLTQTAVDVFAFDAVAANRDLESLREAVRLYTGDLLEDCTENWIQWEREARRHAYQDALKLLIEQAQASGDVATGEKYLRLAIAADQFNEANRCSLIRLLMRRGEYNAALDVFDQYDAQLHDLKRAVGPEIQRLRERITDKIIQEKHRSSVSKSSSVSPIYRISQSTRMLIGREKAVGEVAALFLFGRLVTLKGPPGIGKTQLALQVAANLREDYPDGTVFFDLTDQKSPIDVWKVLASVLQIPDLLRHSVEEAVCRCLEPRQMLLVLDNCEHLIHSGTSVVREILQECPYIRILAASRTAWGTIPGERVYTVPPLTLPGATVLKRLPNDPLPELNEFSAIRLFLERAGEIHSGFTLTSQDARTVARICHLLDGAPLAILLAAGWIQTLTPDQILDRLSKGLDILRDTRQAVSVRQSRLMLTLEDSYQRLSPPLQTLFRYLSVFHGGWTLKAAEEVCQTPRILDGIRQLQECSLVEAERDGFEMRFRLLGILRQFGERLLAQNAETTAIRHRHLEYFLRVSEAAAPELNSSHQEATLAHLDREAENFTTALEWAYENRATEAGLRLASALWRFWHVRGHYQEGLFWLERLLLQGPMVIGPIRSKALNGAGNLAYQSHDYARARAWFQERLEFEQAQGNTRALAGTLGNLANVASGCGDYAQARTLFERSLAYFRELEDKRGIVMTLGNLAVVSCKEGKLEEACSFHEECAAFFDSVGDMNSRAVALNNSADIHISLKDYDKAATLLKESLVTSRDQESRYTLVQSLTLTFFLLTKRDSLERAAVLLSAKEAFLKRIQLSLPADAQEEYRRCIAHIRVGIGEAAFQRAHVRGSLMTLEEMVAFALESLDAH